MIIGIVGHEKAKFSYLAKTGAIDIINGLINWHLMHANGEPFAVSSGRCPLGGIDYWAEMRYERSVFNPDMSFIFPPKVNNWHSGYKPRNIQIATASNEVYCLAVDALPMNYKGMKFDKCYHCAKHEEYAKVPHVKGGGCWTMHYARKLGKPGTLIVINQRNGHEVARVRTP